MVKMLIDFYVELSDLCGIVLRCGQKISWMEVSSHLLPLAKVSTSLLKSSNVVFMVAASLQAEGPLYVIIVIFWDFFQFGFIVKTVPR